MASKVTVLTKKTAKFITVNVCSWNACKQLRI